MAQDIYSNHNICVEAVFTDTNNVCICSRAHLRDYYQRSYEYENYAEQNDSYDPYKSGLNESSNNPGWPIDGDLLEEYELMKSMGLPTSFGCNKRKNYKKCSYEDDDYYEEVDDEQYDNEEYDGDYYEDDDCYNTEGYEDFEAEDVPAAGSSNAKTSDNATSINQTAETKISENMKTEWKNFWDLHGETIIMNSWMQKYKDYINPEYYKKNEESLFDFKNISYILHSISLQGNASKSPETKTQAEAVNIDESAGSKDTEMDFQTDVSTSNCEMNTKDSTVSSEIGSMDKESINSAKRKIELLDADDKENNIDSYVDEIKENSPCDDKYDAVMDTEIDYDDDLDEMKAEFPFLFEKKEYNNMFTCSAPSDECFAKTGISEPTWDELWFIHCQEQHDFHYKLFVESNLKKKSESREDDDVSKNLKCISCGEYNCDFCFSNDYEHVYNLSALDACNNLSNDFVPVAYDKELDQKIFESDDDSVLIKGLCISENIPSLDDEHVKMNDSVKVIQNGTEVSDDEPPVEIPIHIKRACETDSEDTEPISQILGLGYVIKPTDTLKIKKHKKRRHRKRYQMMNPPREMSSAEREQESACKEENDEIDEKIFEDLEITNRVEIPKNQLEMSVNEVVDSALDASRDEACSSKQKMDSYLEDPALNKYWHQRYRLFYRFDEGIKMDQESWFSVTPERIAQHVADRCACGLIVDAFCGAGGNAIQFAFTCNHVIAIDIDPKKIELARHNAEVYGVANKIDFIVADFFAIAPSLKADIVFLSPPWGGPEYIKDVEYDISNITPDIYKTIEVARRITDNIALFIPKNTIINQLMELAGENNPVEVEQNFLNKKVKTLTAYYGKLIQHADDEPT